MQRTTFELDGQSLVTSDLIRSASDMPVMVRGNDGEASLKSILDEAASGFALGRPASDVVGTLASRLHVLRRDLDSATWSLLCPIARNHEVAVYLNQDPLTNWSVTKPRGYSGDASLLDIYYRHASMAGLLAGSTPLGREIHDVTLNVAACEGGRERRTILARTVDDTADRAGSEAEVLSVAAGHLREAELSRSLAEGRIGRWVALDQDPVSVDTMLRDRPSEAVQPVVGSVLGLLRRSYDLGSFDLVYASGLFDYLQEKTAVKLVDRLLEHVKPGGEFLFANFSDEVVSDGYMETFMDWPLILRSADDMRRILAQASRGRHEFDVWYGSNRTVVYGLLKVRA
jgi:hypothetical protein